MVQSFLIGVLFFSFSAQADLFESGSEKESSHSKIPALVEKLKALNMKDDPQYEESFNLTVKEIENAVEQEKLYCSGEASNDEGKTLPPAQKQLCMRELKKNYVLATATIFETKRKYLSLIHQKQLQRLVEIQKKLQQEIEKKF